MLIFGGTRFFCIYEAVDGSSYKVIIDQALPCARSLMRWQSWGTTRTTSGGEKLLFSSSEIGLQCVQHWSQLMLKIVKIKRLSFAYWQILHLLQTQQKFSTQIFDRICKTDLTTGVSHCWFNRDVLYYNILTIPHICHFLYTGKIFQAKILHPKARKLRQIEFRDKIA